MSAFIVLYIDSENRISNAYYLTDGLQELFSVIAKLLYDANGEHGVAKRVSGAQSSTPLTVAMYCDLTQAFVVALKNGAVPRILPMWRATLVAAVMRQVDSAVSAYRDDIQAKLTDAKAKNLLVESNMLHQWHLISMEEVIRIFNFFF